MCEYIYIHMYIHICSYTYMCVCVCVRVVVWVGACVRVRVCVCVCVCMCVCVLLICVLLMYACVQFNKGNLFVKLNVKFPKIEDMGPEMFAELAKLLPASPAVDTSEEVCCSLLQCVPGRCIELCCIAACWCVRRGCRVLQCLVAVCYNRVYAAEDVAAWCIEL